MKTTTMGSMLLTGLMITGSGVIAEEPSKPPTPPGIQMSEQMTLVQKRTIPNENHEVLKAFVGTWSYTGSFWMAPDAPPEAMIGTAECKMAYDGRFLKQKITGPWMGSTFEGLGFIGYDNIKEAYVSTWLDNSTTGIMLVMGEYDAATKTLEFEGTMSCPMTGEKERYYRSQWTVYDEDSNTYTSYSRGPDGAEFKSMVLTYTRVR